MHVHVLYAHEEPRADQRSEYLAKHGEEIKFTEIPCALPPRRASGRGGWSCTFEDRYNDLRYVAKPRVPHLILSSPLTSH